MTIGGEYWISWSYSNIPGHTPGATAYATKAARQEVLDNKEKWKTDCYPSRTFETDARGDVI